MTGNPSVLLAAAVAAGQKLLTLGFDMNPQSAGKLSALKNTIIGVDITDIGWQLFFIPRGGRLEITSFIQGEPDTWIKSDVINLLKSRQADPGDGVNFEISGDIAAGQTFQHILQSMDFDWEELLAMCVGDIGAHRIGSGMRAADKWLKRSGDSLSFSGGEYLREEIEIAASAKQIKQFVCEVDELRDDMERLAARMRRLRK